MRNRTRGGGRKTGEADQKVTIDVDFKTVFKVTDVFHHSITHKLASEGNQNMTPQNMSQHKNHFEIKAAKCRR